VKSVIFEGIKYFGEIFQYCCKLPFPVNPEILVNRCLLSRDCIVSSGTFLSHLVPYVLRCVFVPVLEFGLIFSALVLLAG